MKKHIIVLTVVSVLVVALCQGYFYLGLPLLQVLYNPLTDDSSENKDKVTIEGDLLDKDSEWYVQIGTDDDDDEEEEEIETPGAGVTAEVKQIKASQLKLSETAKNILLLGYNDEEGNTDTIVVVSIEESTKQAKVFSINRDTYVPHSQAVQDAMKKARFYYSAGSFKINAVTYIGREIIHYEGKFGNSGVDYLCAILEQMIPNCTIDDYAYVNFDGFKDFIDTVGGVEVTVGEDMYDKKVTGVTELVLAKGKQKLNGEQALYYVRHRYRLDSNGNNTYTGGDTYRKTNQINFIVEVTPQIFNLKTLTVSQMSKLLDEVKDSVHHSITASELSSYISIARDYANNEYSISPYVISGDEIDPFGDGCCYVRLN